MARDVLKLSSRPRLLLGDDGFVMRIFLMISAQKTPCELKFALCVEAALNRAQESEYLLFVIILVA